MSSPKIATLIHERLFTIYLYCFPVGIAAAFSLSAQATSAFPISLPPLDSPFEGIALADVLFANYLHEKPNINWAEPYMFLPQRYDRFFVYPVTRGNVNEDENKAVSSAHPEGASAPDKSEDVAASTSAYDASESEPESDSAHDESESEPESDSAHDESESEPESDSAHDESESEPESASEYDEPEGATAIDNSVYRLWLLEQVQRIDLDFFKTSVLSVDSSLIDDQRLAEILNSNFHNFPNVAIQKFLGKYFESLTSEQLTGWFSYLLKSPPKILQVFTQSLPESLIEAVLPTLPQEILDTLRENVFFSDSIIKVVLPITLAFLHEQERGISLEENEYYQQLSSGHLPRQQPPQRSFILTPADFQRRAVFIRMRKNQELLLTASAHTHRARRQLATPEECYQTYLQTLISIFLKDPDELIAGAKALYTKATHSPHPLNEYGLFYVPSERWLSPVVEAIRQQAGEKPVGLEIAAGSGSLSHFLNSHYNIPMTATDNFITYQEVTRNTNDNLRTDVIRADALTAVRNHPEANFLVLSWPDHDMNTETSESFEAIMTNLREKDDSFYRVVIGYIQEDYPFLAAILEWNDRGPILFIGELQAGSSTGSEPLRAYLQQHFDAISFKDFYQPLPFNRDYPTLFVTKTKDQSGKAADKGKDANKSAP